MAGSKLNDYGIGDENIEAVQLTLDKTFKNLQPVSLTNYDNDTVPAVAAGSVVEVNGAYYKFDTEEAISTTDPVTSLTVADGVVYIYFVPSGDTVTVAFSATAPTWSDSKQGHYGTAGQANYRSTHAVWYKSSTTYAGKTRLKKDEGFYISDNLHASIRTKHIEDSILIGNTTANEVHNIPQLKTGARFVSLSSLGKNAAKQDYEIEVNVSDTLMFFVIPSAPVTSDFDVIGVINYI